MSLHLLAVRQRWCSFPNVDGPLAFGILGTVMLAGVLRAVMPQAPFESGCILLLGCVGTLVGSVSWADRRARRSEIFEARLLHATTFQSDSVQLRDPCPN
jgi:hypothetical protein